MNHRGKLKEKKRIVVKVGTSSLIHKSTGNINLFRLEKLIRVLTDLHNSGKDVVLVSSGAIGVGFKALGLSRRPDSLPLKRYLRLPLSAAGYYGTASFHAAD